MVIFVLVIDNYLYIYHNIAFYNYYIASVCICISDSRSHVRLAIILIIINKCCDNAGLYVYYTVYNYTTLCCIARRYNIIDIIMIIILLLNDGGHYYIVVRFS